jgi:hypothetical protein
MEKKSAVGFSDRLLLGLTIEPFADYFVGNSDEQKKSQSEWPIPTGFLGSKIGISF